MTPHANDTTTPRPQDATGRPSPARAPDGPGRAPSWTSSAKSGIGCSLSDASHVWFTLGRGVVNEVYHPRIDHAALRDAGFVVTDGEGFFSEESADTRQWAELIAPGVPAYRLVNTCARGRYRIEKEVLADPRRDVLLQRVRFVPLAGPADRLRLYCLIHPRLGDQGRGNTACVEEAPGGATYLSAGRDGHALAARCDVPWADASVGFVGGASDPLAGLRANGRPAGRYTLAEGGNVALAGEVGLAAGGGEFVLAIAFGATPAAAAESAAASLKDGFARALGDYLPPWVRWQRNLIRLDAPATVGGDAPAPPAGWAFPGPARPRVGDGPGGHAPPDLYRVSAMVLRAHRSTRFRGATVASLTIPWGEDRGDGDLGGYHLAWARDLVESASGLLAVGAYEETREALLYLQSTQLADGRWPQEMWLDGRPYRDGVQMDEVALPVLLVDLAVRVSAIGFRECRQMWPMIRAAAEFLSRRGPSTGQDRWEDTSGYSPYTLATEISALLAAAQLADESGEFDRARSWRQTARDWDRDIEKWTYVTGTDLARRAGVEGYYVRIAPPPQGWDGRGASEKAASGLPYTEVVSPDALALVRFGLRRADDPRVLDTVRAIDAATRVHTPWGPCWRRYNGDEYGEHPDGSPFDGGGDHGGRGRAWPLLVGERGHYELAAGRPNEARRLASCMAGFASQVGLLPEQVWDEADLPPRNLYRGRPTGSAMPLAWAHAEYVKLLRSLADGRVFDRPSDAAMRHLRNANP